MVFGDIKSEPNHMDQVEKACRRILGQDFIKEVRVKKWLSGLNQIGSTISCLDMLYHFLRMRNRTDAVVGAYMIRADVELLDSHLSDWPTDKLCFPWRTRYAHLKSPVNDVLFYIPQFLFHDVRAALESPHASVSRDHQNLHWLGEVEKLREHVWLNYDFYFPANTQRLSNPVYVMRGRDTGKDGTAKFREYDRKRKAEVISEPMPKKRPRPILEPEPQKRPTNK